MANLVLGYKILHRIFGKEFEELTAKLCGEGFVVSKDKRRSVNIGDDVGHGKGFTRTGNAQQNLFFLTAFKTLDQLFDRLGLVACGVLIGMYNKLIRHLPAPFTVMIHQV